VQLSWAKFSGGCGSWGWPDWARYLLGIVLALILFALIFFLIKRCLARRPAVAPVPAVQLAPGGAPAAGEGVLAYSLPSLQGLTFRGVHASVPSRLIP
jgi:hypothetical protein